MTLLTIRLPSGAEAPTVALIDEVAAARGMTRSQWVRSVIMRELKALGHAPERSPNDDLRAYAAARSDEAMFEAHRAFEMEHPSPRDAHLRPRAPRRPSILRVRVSISAQEAIALEAVGRAYAMPIQQVATIIVRRWLGLNKKPTAALFGALSGIRAEIRRIGVNINQLAHAANKLLADARLRRQDDLVDQLTQLGTLRQQVDDAMRQMQEVMGLDRGFWGSLAARPDDRLDLLAHPSSEHTYLDDDPP